MRLTLLFFVISATASGQWTLQESHSTASLRGVHSIGNGVVWASGSNGTVLRTVDSGKKWETCAVPPGGEKLDFRGVQAFDAKTAMVMSSGKGDLSRLYKTEDGCKSWTLLRTNSVPEGFWDALAIHNHDSGEIVGDPVDGNFYALSMMAGKWLEECDDPFAPTARKGEAAFAASNSSLLSFGRRDYMLGTGGTSGARVVFFREELVEGSNDLLHSVQESRDVPVGSRTEASGIFSLGMQDRQHIVAVGGDYTKAADSANTAAFTVDGGYHWSASATMPHGYRSAVGYAPSDKVWVTVGPNGTDVSLDDGKNWKALKPGALDAPDADQHWNALSLPFVVGSRGRIGMLRTDALIKP